MKEHPILMQGWGVRATLDDRKSQTRRVMKHQPVGAFIELTSDLGYPASRGNIWAGFGDPEDPIYHKCPYGRPGDLLYFKETWCNAESCGFDARADGGEYWYRATDEGQCMGPWKPSIFMPRWAARIWRRITDIRVERVQAISEADAQAEGIEFRGGYWLAGIHPIKGTLQCWPTAKMAFPRVWDSINAKPKLSKRNPWTRALEKCYVSYPWEDIQETRQHRGKPWYVIGNPWVWAITSEKVDR